MSTKKYSKWSSEWEQEIIRLVGGKKEEKTLKKGEIKPDGTIATEETKIETNDLELLLGQIKNQKEIIKTKKAELGKKSGYSEEAKQILKEIKTLEPQVKEWDKFASWYEDAYTRFLEGGTNGYGTANVGWKALLKTYLESKYKKIANTSPSETNNATATEDYGSNLYEFNTRTETDNNQISYWKITENEVIKLITRTVKELGAIDYNKFVAYTNAHAHPLLTDTHEIDKTEFTATKLQGYLKAIQDRAKHLVDNTIKTDNHPNKGKPANGKRVEYSFGQDYTKHGSTTPVDSGNFTETELIGLFRLMKACQDSTWSNHTDFKTATSQVKNSSLIVLPAQTKPIPSSKLKDWGIEGYVDSNGQSNFYATDYGSKVDNDDEDHIEYSWDTQKELKIESGIKGWALLIHGITHTGYNDFTNRQKLISSFTDDPVRQLFTDIRSYVLKDNSLKTDKDASGTTTPDYGCFGSGTNRWNYLGFPDFHLTEESRLNEYETEKASLLESVKTGRESLKTTEKEHQQAKQELLKKKKEIDNKITEAITAKRKELKEKFSVSDTQTNDFTNNNKILASKHREFRQLVQDIRFLVNNDEEQPTGQTNEDNAYQASKDIFAKIEKDFYLVNQGWRDMLKDDSGSGETCKTDEQRIKRIKENKAELVLGWNLNWYHDKLVELEKLIILADWQIQAKSQLKSAIDNQTPEENISDWQNTLKKYDTNLATVLTEAKINKWKQKKDGQAKFDNLAALETLLKKVCVFKTEDGKEVFDKVEEGFITALKKIKTKKADGTEETGQIDTLAKLITEKDPIEVIKLITYYTEYEKLSAEAKKTKKQQLVWTLEKKDKNGKYLEDGDLTEEEIKTVLYEIALGKKTLASQKKTDSSETPTDSNNQNDDKKLDSWWKFGPGNYGKPLLSYGLILLSLIGIITLAFWEKIQGWWKEPEDLAGESESKEEEKDDE